MELSEGDVFSMPITQPTKASAPIVELPEHKEPKEPIEVVTGDI